MSRLEIFQVDAFTPHPFGGNPAGVVPNAEGLTDEQMRRIAAEMNVAETAFVTPTTCAGADLRLRWFTPTGQEVTFCGHATVATVHLLVETGRVSGDRLVFDTLGGLLPVVVSPALDGRVIWLEPALPTCSPYHEVLAPILDALGLSLDGLGSWAQPALTPERDLLIPATRLDVLKSLAPDMQRLARLGLDRGIRGFCLTSREPLDPDSLTHSRFFAPHYGIPEDPVTGSVHASLAVWLWQAGLLSVRGGPAAFQAEQGDLLGRPGRLRVELHMAAGRPVRVRVGGQAVTVLSGTLRIQ
ncbi:MAG: PhzF family phenazine biosynthesis protein [Deltaproteobacteria bacterium]|nr:PhzF family phenazine biosynthesis protein [Deltaproteobacteria bacterium]